MGCHDFLSFAFFAFNTAGESICESSLSIRLESFQSRQAHETVQVSKGLFPFSMMTGLGCAETGDRCIEKVQPARRIDRFAVFCSADSFSNDSHNHRRQVNERIVECM